MHFRTLLQCSVAAVSLLSFAASAQASDIAVTSAEIAGGKLVITGTTATANMRVRLDGKTGTAFNATSDGSKAFSFSLAYLPSDCVVSLQKVNPSSLGTSNEAVVGNCARGPSPRGEWSGAAEYSTSDIVTYQGSSWLARRDNADSKPQAGADWQLFAKGIDGTGGSTEEASQKASPDGPAGGDLAGTYPNPTIKALAVTAAKINNGAVTTTKIADGGVTNPDIADDAVTARTIHDGAVGNAQLQTNAVTALKIATDAVTARTIFDGAVRSQEISDESVGAADLAPDSVGSSEIQLGAVGATELAADAVTTTATADNSLTGSDIDESTLNLGGFFVAASTTGSCSANDGIENCAIAPVTLPRAGRLLLTATGEWHTFSLDDTHGADSAIDDTTLVAGRCGLTVDGNQIGTTASMGERQPAGPFPSHPIDSGGTMALTALSSLLPAADHQIAVACSEVDGDIDWREINIVAEFVPGP